MRRLMLSILVLIAVGLPGVWPREKSTNLTVSRLVDQLRGKQGTERLDILIKLAETFLYNDPKGAIVYGTEAAELAGHLDNLRVKGLALYHVSAAQWELKFFEKAHESIEKSLAIFESIQDKDNIWAANIRMGGFFYRRTIYYKALEKYTNCLNLARELKDQKKEAESNYQLGKVWLSRGKPQKAMLFFNKAIQNSQETSKRRKIIYLNNKAIALLKLKKYKEALKGYYQSHNLAKTLEGNRKVYLTLCMFNIGHTHSKLNEYDKALDFLLGAWDLYKESTDKNGQCRILTFIGQQYFHKKQFQVAEGYYLKALGMLDQIAEKNLKQILYQELFVFYKSLRKFEKALKFHELYTEVTDKVLNDKSEKEFLRLQEQYEAERRDQDIRLLEKEKKVQIIMFSAVGAVLLLVLALIFKKYLYLFAFWKRKNYIAHYRITRKIASGGMGTVYRVHELGDKTREYALKVLREEFFDDEKYKKRFKNEASIIDQLDHPHIVKVVERGEAQENLYITMELLEGKNLLELIEAQGKLELKVATSIMTQVTDALAMIHHQNIIHRDLKPENIMIIEREGNPYYVKILDFGCARSQSLVKLTQTGFVMGTLHYLSPEQVAGSELTTASDIYSMGVIFYQILSGEQLFAGESAVIIVRQIMEKEPRKINKVRKDVPPELGELIMRMLNKDPGKRPVALEVLSALANFADLREERPDPPE